MISLQNISDQMEMMCGVAYTSSDKTLEEERIKDYKGYK